MEQKINIAELLKDCPKGMELDCTMIDNVVFEKLDVRSSHHPIIIRRTDSKDSNTTIHLTKYGQYSDEEDYKCVIYPKGKTTWEGFQRPFEDGDIVAYDDPYRDYLQIFIFKDKKENNTLSDCYLMLDVEDDELYLEDGMYYVTRFATEEEKKKLFQAIKNNGYNWNAETKTLEKLEQTWTIQDAKDGDVLAFDDETIVIFKDLYNNTSFHSYCHIEDGIFTISKEDMPDWWRTKGFYPATEEQRTLLFRKIKEAGYHWYAETKTLEKLTVPSTPEKFYIRIGDIPSEEKSAVHRGDVVVGYEDGVSVYDCVETDGLYRIVMPFPLKEGQGMTYECLIQEITQCRYEIENPRNVYLVSGIEVGKGNDNEPVIKNVKILKDLTEQFNTKNDNTEETKTLEKLIEPKFKVGDEIVKRNSISNSWIVSSVSSEYYGLKSSNGIEGIGVLSVSEQDNYEILPKTDKFDVTNFEPFMKVLVRSDNSDVWECDFFSSYNPKCSNRFHCIGAWYNICIPYIGNEHLRGTTDDCDEFYKNW